MARVYLFFAPCRLRSANPKNCAFLAMFFLSARSASLRATAGSFLRKFLYHEASRSLEKKNPNLLFFVVFVSFVVEFGLRLAALCRCVEFHQCYCMDTAQFMSHT